MSRSRTPFFGFLLSVLAVPAVAETAIKPVPPFECQKFAVLLSKASGMKLDGSEQDAPTYPDGLRGKACRMSASATGLTVPFEKAESRIDAALKGLKGWAHDGAYDADGPFATTKVFAKDEKRVVYSLAKEPPKGSCTDDRPIGDCKLAAKRWIWSFSASVYMQ